MVIVTKEMVAEIAHRLHNYNGKCENVHGHSYRFQVSVTHFLGMEFDRTGMIIDFKELKVEMGKVLDLWDHSLILHYADPLIAYLTDAPGINLVRFSDMPTAENMARHLGITLNKNLRSVCHIVAVKVWETSTSYAEWRP